MATPSRPRRGTESAPRRRLKTNYSSRSPNPIDIHVGARVRLRRNLLGMTLETLAKAVGVTYQQLQKYEQPRRRLEAVHPRPGAGGAGRLFLRRPARRRQTRARATVQGPRRGTGARPP